MDYWFLTPIACFLAGAGFYAIVRILQNKE